MKIRNIENLENWLKVVAKKYYGDSKPYIEELTKQWVDTGSTIYELNKRQTKSGKVEGYEYGVELHFYNNNDEEIIPEENEHAYVDIEFIF